MNDELVQAAIQTFCIVPEVYQQAFQQAGADFPDELVQQIKQNPESAVKMVQSDEQLGNAIVQIFSENQEAIMQAAQQTQQQQTGMFKKGGKLAYLQTGGKVNKSQNKPTFNAPILNIKKGAAGMLTDNPDGKTRASGVSNTPESGRVTYDITVDPEKRDTTVTYRYPSYNGTAHFTPYGAYTREWFNEDGGFGTKYYDSEYAKRHPRRSIFGRLNNEILQNVRNLMNNHIGELK